MLNPLLACEAAAPFSSSAAPAGGDSNSVPHCAGPSRGMPAAAATPGPRCVPPPQHERRLLMRRRRSPAPPTARRGPCPSHRPTRLGPAGRAGCGASILATPRPRPAGRPPDTTDGGGVGRGQERRPCPGRLLLRRPPASSPPRGTRRQGRAGRARWCGAGRDVRARSGRGGGSPGRMGFE